MDFYGNGQKTLEFVLSKYIPIDISEPFFLFFIGRGSHRLPNVLSPLRGSFVPQPKSLSDEGILCRR